MEKEERKVYEFKNRTELIQKFGVGHGYQPTVHLRFKNGKLQQMYWNSENFLGTNITVFVEVEEVNDYVELEEVNE